MDSQTLKQIEELYHAVAGMPAGDRFEYYRSSDGGANANLRNEVESLLSFEKISDSFIDTSRNCFRTNNNRRHLSVKLSVITRSRSFSVKAGWAKSTWPMTTCSIARSR